MDAALGLVGRGENFSSISLREVAKNAGVVPTSFYRHFTDMEELGLNVVDDLGLLLRKLMRNSRQSGAYAEALNRSSIEVYTDFVSEHKNYFYFMCQCRTGGTLALRSAIRNEFKYFASELATDIRALPLLNQVNSLDLDMMAQLMVETVFESTIDFLDQADTSPNFRQEFINLMVKKLRLIWLGAGEWRS